MFTPDWIQAAGAENADGVYISGPDLTALAGDTEFYTNEFLPAYKEAYGANRSRCSTPTPSMRPTGVLRRSRKWPSRRTTPSSSRGPRSRTPCTPSDGYQGVTGNLTCDDNGDCQSTATMATWWLRAVSSARAGLQPDDQSGRRPGRRLTRNRVDGAGLTPAPLGFTHLEGAGRHMTDITQRNYRLGGSDGGFPVRRTIRWVLGCIIIWSSSPGRWRPCRPADSHAEDWVGLFVTGVARGASTP